MSETVLRCKSTARDCRELARSVASFLHESTSDPDTLYDVELLVTEACSNVIIHGYNQKEDGDIEIRISLDNPSRVTLELQDWGEPYAGPTGELLNPDPFTESGRGLYIISQLSDTYSYKHAQGKNILRIEKNLDKI